MNRIRWSLLMLALAALIAAPLARADEDEEKEHEAARKGLAKAKITLIQAVEAALNKVPGKAVEANLELEADQVLFEVEVIAAGKHKEVEVDAITGKVKEVKDESVEEQKEEEDEEQREEAAAKAPITLVQAVTTALKAVKGAKAFEAEPKMNDSLLVFEVEMLVDGKIKKAEVATTNGKLVAVMDE